MVLEILPFLHLPLPHQPFARLLQQLPSEVTFCRHPQREAIYFQRMLLLLWKSIDEKADTTKMALEQDPARFSCISLLSLTQWQTKRSLVPSETQHLSLPTSGNGSLSTAILQWDLVSLGCLHRTPKMFRMDVTRLGTGVLCHQNGIVNVEADLPTILLHMPNNNRTTPPAPTPLYTPINVSWP